MIWACEGLGPVHNGLRELSKRKEELGERAAKGDGVFDRTEMTYYPSRDYQNALRFYVSEASPLHAINYLKGPVYAFGLWQIPLAKGTS